METNTSPTTEIRRKFIFVTGYSEPITKEEAEEYDEVVFLWHKLKRAKILDPNLMDWNPLPQEETWRAMVTEPTLLPGLTELEWPVAWRLFADDHFRLLSVDIDSTAALNWFRTHFYSAAIPVIEVRPDMLEAFLDTNGKFRTCFLDTELKALDPSLLFTGPTGYIYHGDIIYPNLFRIEGEYYAMCRVVAFPPQAEEVAQLRRVTHGRPRLCLEHYVQSDKDYVLTTKGVNWSVAHLDKEAIYPDEET